jgi:hypothetical protein
MISFIKFIEEIMARPLLLGCELAYKIGVR